jgi:hypothetical protein
VARAALAIYGPVAAAPGIDEVGGRDWPADAWPEAPRPRVETERMTLRLPEHGDWRQWSEVRAASAEFLTKWEPVGPKTI